MSCSPPTPASQGSTSTAEVDCALGELEKGAVRLASLPLRQRIELAASCVMSVHASAREWTELACQAKQIPSSSSARAEEITAGPVSVLRYLQLLLQSLRDIERFGEPRLPASPIQVEDQIRVSVFPTKQLFDRLLFAPIEVETWLRADADPSQPFGDCPAQLQNGSNEAMVAVVLGAGNVSAIPATDALTKILQDNQAVLLKMNPVNDYLGSVLAKALKPLIDSGFLRIVYGDSRVGSVALSSDRVDCVHITGSNHSHDAIVWGADDSDRRKARNEPLLSKPITSELGNVTPWVILPDRYTNRELEFQAENIASSITNNASFNCVATKMLVTWEGWPQRELFLDLIDRTLDRTNRRVAYYPGAADRFKRFAGDEGGLDAEGTLPWTLLRNADPVLRPLLFNEESFVCVCGETSLGGATPDVFLAQAVEFLNDRLWGTLAAALTVTSRFRKQYARQLDDAIRKLRYGTIGLNQWPALTYALMSPPWGAFPADKLADVQSGMGTVHNTFLLDRVEKSVLSSPTTIWPKPIWFASHQNPEAVAWNLCDLYARPSAVQLPRLFFNALRG